MKAFYSPDLMVYDGTQLRSLFAYSQFKLIGDSIVAWQGPCNIPFEHMVDFEDKIAQSEICGAHMLHFIVEMFNPGLVAGVSLQRLLASIVMEYLNRFLVQNENRQKNEQNNEQEIGKEDEEARGKRSLELLRREGDDIYFCDAKLSISICSISSVSTMIHFAVNVVNEGTPVKTFSLGQLGVSTEQLATDVLQLFCEEYQSIVLATKKVKPL